MVAVIIVAKVAAIRALSPNLEMSAALLGAIPPIPPIWIAIELKLAKPQSA